METIDDDSLFLHILSKVWHNSLIIGSFSLPFLSLSYGRLIDGNTIRKKIEFIIPEKIVKKRELTLNISDKTFKEELTEFFNKAVKKLPCNLKELLFQAPDSNESYNWFLYCLHLIQKHILEYDKKSGILKWTGKNMEEI